MNFPFYDLGWAIAAVVVLLAPLLVGLDRWWVFPAVGAGIGCVDAVVLGAVSRSATAIVLLLAFLVPVQAVIVGYCRNPTALNLTVAGLWISFLLWVLRALRLTSSPLGLSAYILPVMFLFLVVTIAAYQKGSSSPGARGRATLELNAALMFVVVGFAYPDKEISLYLLVAGMVLCFLGVWGLLPQVLQPRSPSTGAPQRPGAQAGPPSAGPSPPDAGRQYCPSCGAENEGDSVFCRKCGRGLAPSSTKSGDGDAKVAG